MSRDPIITTLIFDLGGVLIDWNPRYLYRNIFDDPSEVDWFLETICTRGWHVQQDAGRSTQLATDQLVKQHPEHETEIRAFYGRFNEMISGPILGTVEVLGALKAQGTPLYALSNWPAETFPPADSAFDFLEWFDGIVVSGQEKVMKPDPAIFEILCERYGLNPGECLFVDDVIENVEAAKNLGVHVHHFIGSDELHIDLQDRGLLHDT